LKVTQFKKEAQKQAIPIEPIRQAFEEALAQKNLFGVISPDKTEAICFGQDEIDALVSELSNGKIELTYLAQQLNLTDYQLYLVLQYLLKTNRIDGELTYSTFVSKDAARKVLYQKAVAHKRLHRLKMMHKR
jgi:hypothetical protein